ncbi:MULTISPECIES: transketolase [unclassified Curtobacterium]|uniref:transketolase n=1 Tax=unclassified Curtobacterium TaxID=257496 RepID=UPI0008DE3600|nr:MULTISPECIES: transketolase [unclassified Curtobacterium]OIH99560.1 transketolase [Curtobacterium sp. MCBA15_003]OII30605.1 transketolase [Curtobacterium sp. MMLR14_006]
MTTDVGRNAIDTARMLAIDAVEAAGSGHPGTAAALAPVAHLLFQEHIRHDPASPEWPGRDRFVLSCGHASILLYTQLFLTGYGLTVDDLRAFRSAGSRTPGHPEFGHTPGVETTTGPLGQGLATAVGMAMALKRDRARLDPDSPAGTSPFDQRVWVLASDGDLQEGISYEAGALAGRHGLGNLTVVYDDNDIQIEGSTTLTSSEDTGARFAAQGWRVDHVATTPDGDVDLATLHRVLSGERDDRPHLVVLASQIAWPAPNATGTAASHGAPLGAAETAATRAALGIDREPFDVPAEVLAHTRRAVDRGEALRAAWDTAFAAWTDAHPQAASEHARAARGELPAGLTTGLPTFEPGTQLATRDASGRVIQALAERMPELWGGSADLAEPNRTAIVDGGSFLPSSPTGRNVHWGVREHAMAAAMNGITLAGGSRFFAGTFLVFSDYQRPATRLAALMQLPVTYVWSHDSVALGADGPTHQPIEHLASLRAMPGFAVVRPADGNETVAAWAAVLERRAPAGLVLARQPLPVADTPVDAVREGVARGAYVVRDTDGAPDVVVVATGSEVALALQAAEQVPDLAVRVVSMPCREWFEAGDADHRERVLPRSVRARVVVEAASPFGWEGIAGPDGVVVGIDEFGVSAPAADALAARGMTVERVVEALRTVAARV